MTYTVRPGDTISEIAMRNGVTGAQLLQANPQIKDQNKIKVGDVLNVPNDATTKPDGNLAYFSKSSPSVQKGVANRFKSELQDALALLAKNV